SGFPDPFREGGDGGGSSGEVRDMTEGLGGVMTGISNSTEGLFSPPATGSPQGQPQSLSLSQGSIGGGGCSVVGSSGLVKCDSDTAGLSHPQQSSTTIPPQVSPTSHNPRHHRRNVSDTQAYN
ncbi:unnamed protein product, partial [Meganyctiphanes norvegica]